MLRKNKYNAPNKVAFFQLELGLYNKMALNINSTKKPYNLSKNYMILTLKEEIMTQFINNKVVSLQLLGEEENTSVCLLQRFCRLDKVSHSKFQCSHCQK